MLYTLEQYANSLSPYSDAGWVELRPGDEVVYQVQTSYGGVALRGYVGWGDTVLGVYVRAYVIVTLRELLPAQPYIPPTPAVPAVPAQTLYDFNVGWNAGARSVATCSGAGVYSFQVPPSVAGAVVGLAQEDPDGDLRGMGHAVYFSDGVVYAMEYGRIKATIGANTGQVWGIRRVRGEVDILADGVSVHTFPTPINGPVFLDSSLYVGGDRIASPSFAAGGEGESFLPSLVSLSGDYATYAMGGGELPALTAGGFGEEMIYMQGLTALGGATAFAGGTATLPRLSGLAEDGGTPAPSVGVGGGVLNYLTAAAAGVVGGVGAGSGALQALQGVGAVEGYSSGYAALPSLVTVAGGDVNGALYLGFYGYATGMVSSAAAAVLSLLFRAQVEATMSAARVHMMSVEATGGAVASLTATAEYLLELLFQAAGVAPLADPNAVSFAWACAQRGGQVSRYDGYGFQSFAEIAGRHYGVRTDGVYLLEGETDNGLPIAATAHFGKLDFKSPALKTVPNVYVGVGAQEALFLRVETRQGTFMYRARCASASMRTQRFDLGRGLRDNWFDFVLISPDCRDFNMDNIEFTPVMSKRRI